MARLDSKFFLRDTVAAAQDLLGRYLIRRDGGETIVCRITETEAYVGAAARRRFGVPAAEMTAYQRKNFMNGPGKLCKGLSIDRSLNGLPLGNGLLELACDLPELGLPRRPDGMPFHTGKRVGIDYAEEAVDFPWRFWLDE